MKNVPIKLTEQNWAKDTIPVVSVFSWVFNQKEFIRQSIESILMQETTFPVEIIIQDDASNDGTRQIIEQYQSKYPNVFKNIFFSENQHSQGKSIMNELFKKPKGKYISLIHGDDYWTDPNKLQKQVDFLDSNLNFSFCAHNVIEDYGRKQFISPNLETCTLDSKDLLTRFDCNFIPTCSIMYRKELISSGLPSWYNEMPFSDWPLLIYLSTKGKGYFMQYNMGVYRKHELGFTSVNKSRMSLQIRDFYILINFIYPEFKKITHDNLNKLTNSIIVQRSNSIQLLSGELKVSDVCKILLYKIRNRFF